MIRTRNFGVGRDSTLGSAKSVAGTNLHLTGEGLKHSRSADARGPEAVKGVREETPIEEGGCGRKSAGPRWCG